MTSATGTEIRRRQRAAATRARPGLRALRLDRGLLLLIGLYLLTLPLVTHDIRAADEIEYFAYLRSMAFDRDLDFQNEYQYFVDRFPEKYTASGFKRTFLDTVTPTGKRPNYGPIGTAILWSPFYAAGHLVAVGARATGADIALDGYSPPYIWAITFGSAFYALAGLLLAYRLSRALVGPAPAFWATLTIWLATPVIFYSHLAPGYSHAASLFTISLLLFFWWRWRDEMTWLRWGALGVVGGLAAMVREQDALFLAVPAVYAALGLAKRAERGEKGAGQWRLAPVGELARVVAGVIVMGVVAVATFAPQLIAYRLLNGGGQPNSDVTGKLSLVPPYLLNTVFSPYHGLLFWSPIVLVALVGLALLARRHPRLALALLVGFALTWYINGAIKTWNTAGSFGARRFLNCTPIFVVGLAYAYDLLWRSRAVALRVLVPVLSLAVIAWNGGLIVQFVLEYMSRVRMEWPLVLQNQLRLPGELPGIIHRLLTDRGSFYEH